MNIRINFSDVFARVDMLTAYEGAKNTADPTAYNRVWATSGAAELLLPFFIECTSELFDNIKDFGTYSTANNNVTFDLTLPTRLQNKYLNNNVLTALFTDYYVYYLLSKWYLIAQKDIAKTYSEIAQGKLQHIIQTLYFKQQPE